MEWLGELAFESFRQATAASGSALYEQGMTLRSIEDLQRDVLMGELPAVSWILPSPAQCEHPGASNPEVGAYFISQVLDAITANPAVWSQTALFVTFDVSDGLFDHVSPPAVPSFDAQGIPAGASTVSLDGEYFDGSSGGLLNATGITGSLRPGGDGSAGALGTSAFIGGATITLTFANSGTQSAVFHVYDQLHLDRTPRRYTVEAGKSLNDLWSAAADAGEYDLGVWRAPAVIHSVLPTAVNRRDALRFVGGSA